MRKNGYEETSALRLECAGLMLGDVAVPPFRLRAGQSVCLHMPPSSWWWEKLLPLMKGKAAHPRLRTLGAMAYLERPMPRRRWWGGWHDSPILDWLVSSKGLTPEEAKAILVRVILPPDLRIGWVGWNERTMLAVEACLLRPPDLLVFDTSGNDSLTACRVFERLSSRTPDLSLIYLKTRKGIDDPCLPGSTCLDLASAPFPASITE